MNNSVCLLEVKPGVGGEEAKIWADDLLNMYRKYCEKKSWQSSMLEDDFKGSRRILLEHHEQRGILARILEKVVNLFSWFL